MISFADEFELSLMYGVTMMEKVKKLSVSKIKMIHMIGIGVVLFMSVVLLWHVNATSLQADPAMVAQVYFEGEYRIAGGPWRKIVEGEHISSTGLS